MPEPEPDLATLDRLLQVSLDERGIDFQVLDALDTKAGILLAVDGLLIVGATQTANTGIRAGLIIMFIAAAVPAFLALRTERYKRVGTRKVQTRYWDGEPLAVTKQLLGNLAAYAEAMEKSSKSKSRLVTWAFWLTGVAVLLLALASFLPPN